MRSEEKALFPNDQTVEALIKDLRQRGSKVTEEYENSRTPSRITREYPPRKTWWDWLPLILQGLGALLIPVAIFVGTTSFSAQQNKTSQQIAADQQQETTLKTYLDDISDLLLNHGLSLSKPGDEVRQVARERTLTAFRRLDASRNRIVVQFLRDANLLTGKNAIIDLTAADLENDDLRGADLVKVYFSAFDPGEPAGQGYVRQPTTANLSGANLSGANLSEANLIEANLSGANLSGAKLQNADLRQADLQGADLSGAYLVGADFSAIFFGADLRGANLRGALGGNLDGANLSGAIMPDGSKHP